MRATLLVSFALNLCLLTTFVAARVDHSRFPTEGSETYYPLVAELPELNDRLGSLDAVASALGSLDLSEADSKVLLLGWLESAHREAWRYDGPRYWEPGYNPSRIALSRRHATGNSVRAELVRHFGAAAASDPAFASVFRPLDPAYEFLSSDEQILLEEASLVAMSAEALAASRTPDAACRPIGLASEAGGLAAQSPLASGMLSATSTEEYLLRFSPLSEALRSIGVGSEGEFREAAALLSSMEAADDPAGHLEFRARLKALLGDAAFVRIWARIDPGFAPLERFLRHRGHPVAEIEAAYGTLVAAQESQLRLFAAGAPSAELITGAGRIEEHRRNELERLLGKSTAQGLLATLAEFEFSLSRGTPSC